MLSLPTSEESCDNCIRDFSRVSNVFTYKSAEKSDHFLYSKIEEIIHLANQAWTFFITIIDLLMNAPTAKVSRRAYTDKSFMEISVLIIFSRG